MENKFFGLTNDYIFKAVLQRSERVLTELISALMNIPVCEIHSCKILNPIKPGDTIGDKDCILDILLLLNDRTTINIEMQTWYTISWESRSLLYWSRAFDTLKKGDDYRELKPTCHIGILDIDLFPNVQEYYSEYKILNIATHQPYTDLLSIRILNLANIDLAHDSEQEQHLKRWGRIFKAQTLNELKELAGESEVFQEVLSHCVELTEDEEAFYKARARADYESRMKTQYRGGFEEGREHGLEEGLTAIISMLKTDSISPEAVWKKLIAQPFYSHITLEHFMKLWNDTDSFQ